MPATQRRRPAGVIGRLLAAPHRFGFFQAVRLLDRWLVAQGDATGRTTAPAGKLRFRNTLSLAFPASEVAGLAVTLAPGAEARVASAHDAASDPSSATPHAFATVPAGLSATTRGAAAAPATAFHAAMVAATASTPDAPVAGAVERVELTPAFIGLLGSQGALPLAYTEMLAEREQVHRDTAARGFLDVFQHRAVALFYEAWRKHRLPVQYESDRRNAFLPLVLALAGVGQGALRDRLKGDEGGVADDTLAHFAGLVQQRPVSAATLKQTVEGYFGVPVTVEPFVGRWFTLPGDGLTSLGGANAVLGAGAVVGGRVWQRDLRVRLTIGPLDRERFRRFLPGGPAALALRELLTMLTGVSIEYEIRLSLRADAVRGATLAAGDAAPRLGQDGFLVTRPSARDRDDAGYEIHALA